MLDIDDFKRINDTFGRATGDRVRRMVADSPVSLADGGKINLTVSVGIACFPMGGDSEQSLVEHADKALYAAKHAGKNRVCLYGET